MYFVLKSQTYKYSIKLPEANANKIAVSDINNLTETDIQKIKNQINIQYSDKATTQDARLASKKGEVLADKSSVLAENGITVANGTVTVTYKDGSVDTTPIADVARTNEPPTVEIPYSDAAKREIYVYGAEENSFDIKIKDDADKITAATLLQGGNRPFNSVEGEADKINTQYGYTANMFSSETPASEAHPAVIRYSGTTEAVDGITPTRLAEATKGENPPGMVLGWRYVRVTDTEGTNFTGSFGKEVENDHAFRVMLKPQTQKYDVKDLTGSQRITVNDIDNITDTELETIKSRLQLEYSKTNTDARLQDLAGTDVNNPSQLITKVVVSPTDSTKLAVTYNDGSVDTIEKTKVLNVRPKGIIPFSNPTAKEIYVYKGEETDLEFGVTDDSGKIKDLRIVQAKGVVGASGAAQGQVVNQYGLTMTSQTDTNGINATADNPAITRITGTVNVPGNPQYVGTLMTRYLVAEDLEGAVFSPPLQNSNLEQEGAFKLVVREQTQKYNIESQTNEADKIAVSDPDNLSEADLTKIKENIKVKYSTADDARLADKNNTEVENASNYIKSVAKQGDQLVVTYKDGSTDSVPLAGVVKLDKQPAINAVNQAADDQIKAINENAEATKEEKDEAIKKVNADKQKALDEIAKPEVATKDALDKAQKAGTDAIAADNPVVSAKSDAKTAVDEAVKAKEDEIKKNPNLSDQEKADALTKVKEEADKVKAQIDAAPTNSDVTTAADKIGDALKKVNPVGKELAKEAVTNALADKEKAIEGRTDLTPAEKKAAKDKAKELADAQLAKIDEQPDFTDTPEEATTAQTAVNDAEDKGIADVTSVNPVAKEQAKKDIADQLATKNGEIDDRKDLTEEEKATAKAEAKKLADAQLAKIAEQPDNVDDPKALPAVQKAVDDAGNKGVADVKTVNPVAVTKPEAKKAIDEALKAKNDQIDKREDLTADEKKAAKDKAAEEAKKAKEAIDAATTDEAVGKAKESGTTTVGNVSPVAKEQAKNAINDALTAKNDQIDGRKDLTDEEKATAKAEAKKLADAQLDEIAKQPDVADTPEAAQTAQTAVDAAKKTGVDQVTAVNPEAKTKPAAKQAIDDKLAEQLKEIANTPDATDEEKDVAADAAKALAEQAKKEIDNAKTDADVKKLQDAAEEEIEKSVPVVEDKPNARKAIDEATEEKKKEIDSRDDLSPKAKELLKAKADKIAESAKKLVDAATKEADVAKIVQADESAIRAVGDVNRPIDKVVVKDPAKLTDEDKAKILEEVKKVNPIAQEVKYNEEGNIEVTTANGDKGIIIPTKLVKTEDDFDNGKGGNDINKPLDKVIVEDPAKLTDDEKAKIVAAVEAVNPNAIVTIDANGSVSVSTPEGKTAAIPATELVRTKEDAAKPNAGNSAIVKPADKVVGEPTDPAAQAKVEEKLKELNPEAKSVKFDDKGNATVTLNDGTTATIPAKDLFKSPEDVAKPNAGNDIVKPADKVVVDPTQPLSDDAKKAIADKVKAVNPDSTVVVDDKGNATVTTPDGKTAVIPASDLTKSPEEAAKPNAGNDIVKPADKVVVDPTQPLSDDAKKAIADKVKAVNPDSTVVVDDKGNATVTTPEGKTAVIPASDLTKSPEEAAKPNAGNDIVKPADKVVVDPTQPLSDDAKKAIADKVKAVNPDATVVVDDKGNATVTTPEGKTAVIPASDLTKSPEEAAKPNAGNAIVKPADKVVVDPTQPLSDDAKKAIADKVKAVNPGAEVVVDDKGNATVTTPEGKTAVIPASDLTKSPEEAAKPNAGNDIVKPADKTVVANPEKLTDAEKKAIEDKVKAVNPDATVVVDDKGNATVTTPEGKTAVIPASDLTKSPEEAAKPNAGNDIVKPADKVIVDPTQPLSDDAKKAIADKVKAVNPGAEVVVDDKGNATVTTPDGKTAVIPASDLTKSPEEAAKPNAGNDIVKPADKVVVDPTQPLSDDAKKAIADKVKAVNPGAEVVVDDKGNATVTTPEGKTAVIPASDLTKSPEEAAKPNAGNDIVKPADKVVVDPTQPLSDDAKKAIADKVKAVNPGAEVVVDDKGNATVTTPDGKTAVIPASDLTKSPEEAAKPNAGNDIVKPADKVVVDPTQLLSDDAKKAIADKVKAVNPGAEVVVDDKGNATVTTPEGKTAVIPASDLTKSPEDAAKPNAGNDIVKPADKVVVDPTQPLSDDAKKAIADKVKAVNPGAEVVVDDKGNATVTTPDGKTAVIPASDLTKSPEEAAKPNAGNDIVKPADKVVVDPTQPLSEDAKKAIADKVKAVNPGAEVVVDDKGNATVTTPDGKTAVISASDLTKSPEEAAKPNAGNDIVKPADKVVVDPTQPLSEDAKKAIAANVQAVNPDATVVVDDKGNATVTTPDGKTAVIPASDLTKSPEDAAKPNAGNDIVKPADKVVVDPTQPLSDDAKKAIADKVKAVNPGAEVVVDDKGNATVTTPDGKTAVIPASDLTKSPEEAAKPNAGNDIVKPADKVVVDPTQPLSEDAKKAIADKVKAVNPGAEVVVDDKGNATVTTPDGKTAVISASDLTKSPEEAAKPNAGNDIVKPADKVVVDPTQPLSEDAKKAIAANVQAVNPDATVVVDDKGNATVTTPDGKTAVIPASDLTKSPEEAAKPNAGNDIVKPATKTAVKDPANVTPEEQKAIAANVQAVNPGAKVVVDDKGNATVTTPDGKTAVIPASDLIKDAADQLAANNAKIPVAKTPVVNPAELTDAEKKAIAAKVAAVNPDATVVVDDKGNATVATPDGNVSVIPASALVNKKADLEKEIDGNEAKTPAGKTVVANPAELTDAEKKAIAAKVAAVNPGATVVVDDKGNATVAKGDGTVLDIPASDLVIPAEKLADAATDAKVKTPAIRTLVDKKDSLTDTEKEAVKQAIQAVNPGSTVVVDAQGNATVTTPSGDTATITNDLLVKDAKDTSDKNKGNNINLDFDKVLVTNLHNITKEEKEQFQFMILGAINSKDEFDLDAFLKTTDAEGNTVYTSKDPQSKVTITIDKDGNMKVTKEGKTQLAVTFEANGTANIVTEDGKVLAVTAEDIFKQRPYVPSNGGGNNSGNGNGTSDNNAANNTDVKGNKAKLEGAIHQLDELIIKESAKLDAETAKEANALSADAKKVFANADASQAEVDAMVKRIEDFMAKVASSTDHATPANDQATQTPANASQEAATNARKAAKELPNTGTADSTVAMVAAAASALLGLGLAGRRRKEDEEA